MTPVSIRRSILQIVCLWILAGALPLPGSLFLTAARAQLHPPEVQSLYPLGGSLGATTRVTLTGVSLRGASGILFDRPGITARILPPDPSKLPMPTLESDGNPPVVVEFTVAKDAVPGICRYRVVSPAGLSTAGRWAIGRDLPTFEETEPNDTRAQAQAVSLPVAINGHIADAGDRDTFAFDLEPGKTFVAEVFAAAVGSPLDSLLTLRDAAGQEVASNDDFNGPDSLLTYQAPASGRYYLTLSSAVNAGGPNDAYRLSLGYLPLLTGIYPAGVQKGQTTEVHSIGFNLPKTLPLSIPGSLTTGVLPVFAVAPIVSNALPALVSPLPTISEQEPNDDRAHATPMPAPGVANGQFFRADGKPGDDVDFYRFHAEAGRRFLIDAQCQALGSRGDPILTLYDGDGKVMAENDDAVGRDSHLDQTFPKTGDYYLRVKDVPGRSAPDLVYRLIIADPPPPGFTLTTETRERVVGKGDSVPFEVNVARDRWDGPVTLTLADLPPGVRAISTVVPAGITRGLLILTADSSAPMGAFPLHIVGTAQVNGKPVQVTLTRADDWIWQPDKRVTEPIPDGMLQFAVGSPAEIAPKAAVGEVTLIRGQAVKIKVSVEKRVPYNKPIPFAILGLPDGVALTAATLPANQTEMELELKAAPTARVGAFPIAIDSIATHTQVVQLDRVTGPLTLTVAEPPKK